MLYGILYTVILYASVSYSCANTIHKSLFFIEILGIASLSDFSWFTYVPLYTAGPATYDSSPSSTCIKGQSLGTGDVPIPVPYSG